MAAVLPTIARRRMFVVVGQKLLRTAHVCMSALRAIGGAAALALGIPNSVQKLLAVVVGGVLITSVGSVLSLIQGF